MRDLIVKIITEYTETFRINEAEKKWDLNKVLDLAKNYDTITDFRKENNYAYALASRKGWLPDLYKILKRTQTEYRVYSDEEILKIAKNYPTINQFKVNNNNIYQQAYNRGLIPKIKEFIKPAYEKWDYDKVKKEAKKYSSRKEFQKGSPGAYGWAFRNNHLDDITKGYQVKLTKYDDDLILKTALKYETVRDFIDNDYNTYMAAQRRKILPKVTAHMKPLGNQKKRVIYVYEFPDNHVYVGLTYDLTERDRSHRNKERSQVFKHIQKTGLDPLFKQSTPDYVSAEDARILEDKLIEDYRSKGWNILNIAKAGGLGGAKETMSFNDVSSAAKKYKFKNDFRLGDRRAYQTAKREGWYDKVTSHMVDRMETWTPEKVIEMAKQYDNRVQVKRENPKLYSAIARMNLEDLAYKHMGNPRKSGGFQWDLDTLQDEISKYDNISDFRINSPNAYYTIHRYPEYRYLLDSLTTKKKRWSDEEIFDDAMKYNTIIDFRNNSPRAYDNAKRRGLVNDIRIKMGLKPKN